MSSVPFNSTQLPERDLLNPIEKCVAADEYSFSLPPQLIKIRHIRSLWIKCMQTVYEEQTYQRSVQFANVEKIHEDQGRDGSATEDNQQSHLKSLRKGKSIGDMKRNANKEEPKYVKPYKNSLLNQSNEIRRQLKHQETNYNLFHDCFYSISNFMESENPYYISRVFPAHSDISDELNFNILNNSASISLFILHEGKWRLYEQFHIKLSLLINLGSDLKFIKEKLHNIDKIVILELSDDCYYTLLNENLPNEIIVELQEKFKADISWKINNNSFQAESCTYDQIMTINNYSRCIYDLKSTNPVLAARIGNEIHNKSGLKYQMDISEEQRNINLNMATLVNEKREHNSAVSEKIAELKKLRQSLQQKIENLKQGDAKVVQYINDEKERYLKMNEEMIYKVNLEKARMASALLRVFPIELVEGKFEFSLFGVSFPSSMIPHHSKYKHEHIEEIPLTSISSHIMQKLLQIPKSQMEKLNALIGYIALIVSIIFEILNVYPRYHIKFLGSTSYIHDYLSFNKKEGEEIEGTVKRSTIYPLFICANPTLTVKFTYGLFLLRKNLEQLYDIERLVKVEEFNLLTACKIWLTCVESYADVQFQGNIDDGVKVCESADEMDEVDELSTSLIPRTRKVIRSDSVSTSQSVEASVNSFVNEYNHNFLSEERIKHIKKHLLRGISK